MLLALSIVSCSSPNKNPLIVGHRGAMGHVTENTIPSIKKAVELGVDGIEIDVFKCKSGEIIVFHDKKLDRLTNSSGYIEDLSFDSINKIKVMGEYRIPKLKEVMDVLPNENILNLTAEEQKELNYLSENEDVIVTPHVGGLTADSYKLLAEVLAKKINNWIKK